MDNVIKQIGKLDADVLKWYTSSRRENSCQDMVFWLAFGMKKPFPRHPETPDAINQCLLFLEAFPQFRKELKTIGHLSPGWYLIAKEWESIETLFLSEVGFDWKNSKKASRTNEYIQKILAPIQHQYQTEI